MASGSLAVGGGRLKNMRCGASSLRYVTMGMVPPLTLVLSCYAKDKWISCFVIDVLALHNLKISAVLFARCPWLSSSKPE